MIIFMGNLWAFVFAEGFFNTNYHELTTNSHELYLCLIVCHYIIIYVFVHNMGVGSIYNVCKITHNHRYVGKDLLRFSQKRAISCLMLIAVLFGGRRRCSIVVWEKYGSFGDRKRGKMPPKSAA